MLRGMTTGWGLADRSKRISRQIQSCRLACRLACRAKNWRLAGLAKDWRLADKFKNWKPAYLKAKQMEANRPTILLVCHSPAGRLQVSQGLW